jgi:cell division protein FtsB|tara:strand:- start:705 stop:881 length:177 start_codon:yes stop_codon:yes gene_type:complete
MTMSDLDCAKEQIRVLEFRNAKLHQHNEKIEREIIELRNKIKKLEEMHLNQYRNKGDM